MSNPAFRLAHVCSGALMFHAAPTAGATPATQGPLVERRGLATLDLGAVVEHVVPDPDELAWRAIPWRATLRAGLLDAAAEHKPVLLWAMNGHPLGTT